MGNYFARLYAILLHLYPRQFRAEFGDEMQTVFAQAVAERTKESNSKTLAFCLREMRDLPGSLLRQHWFAIRKEDVPVNITKVFYLLALIVLTLGCWLTTTALFGLGGIIGFAPVWLIVCAIVSWLFTPALTAVVQRTSRRVWLYAGLLILFALFLPASTVARLVPTRNAADPFEAPLALTFLGILSLAVIIAALLLYLGLNLYKTRQNTGAAENGGAPEAHQAHTGRAIAATLVLSALLLIKILHSFYWFMVWDTTDDSLGYLWLPVPILATLFASVFLFTIFPGRGKMAGVLYALLVTASLIAVSARAQRVDFRQLTEERAARVSQALERYHASKGRYPASLRQLTPWYARSLPGPVIFYGQAWCYDGGESYYRLGYIYREHWSDPRLIGKIYATKGNVSGLPRMCEAEVTALQKRYPDYPYEYWMDSE